MAHRPLIRRDASSRLRLPEIARRVFFFLVSSSVASGPRARGSDDMYLIKQRNAATLSGRDITWRNQALPRHLGETAAHLAVVRHGVAPWPGVSIKKWRHDDRIDDEIGRDALSEFLSLFLLYASFSSSLGRAYRGCSSLKQGIEARQKPGIGRRPAHWKTRPSVIEGNREK